jgi:hypothetical protein
LSWGSGVMFPRQSVPRAGYKRTDWSSSSVKKALAVTSPRLVH